MDLNEQGWMLALGAGLLLLSKGLRRLIASALQWVALAAFLYGVYQSITAPFERGITELITWTLIACACAVFARFLTPRPTLEPPNPFCGTCRGSRWIRVTTRCSG